jgi:uncharacterized cupin superfamily protein
VHRAEQRLEIGFAPGIKGVSRHNSGMNSPATRLIKLTALPAGTPDIDHPKPERLVRGNPLRETWNRVDAALPAGQVFCGVWRCEPGRWHLSMGENERELFTVLLGRCRVHDAQGGFEEVGPGEGLYIPPGFAGEFEVLEHLTKTYMITE